jgi:branched-chain amino acid transport system substrate-binding protein
MRGMIQGWRLIAVAATCAVAAMSARAADPIRIGFSMALTGSAAANGKVAIIAMKSWQDDSNAKGGRLGR